MAFTRKARQALRQSREGHGDAMLAILRAGELAYLRGADRSSNPYTGEDAELWDEGFEDAKFNAS